MKIDKEVKKNTELSVAEIFTFSLFEIYDFKENKVSGKKLIDEKSISAVRNVDTRVLCITPTEEIESIFKLAKELPLKSGNDYNFCVSADGVSIGGDMRNIQRDIENYKSKVYKIINSGVVTKIVIKEI